MFFLISKLVNVLPTPAILQNTRTSGVCCLPVPWLWHMSPAGTGTGGKWHKEGRKAGDGENKNVKETMKDRKNKRQAP